MIHDKWKLIEYEWHCFVLQGFIENEVDMNDRQSCQAECSAYTITENKGNTFEWKL